MASAFPVSSTPPLAHKAPVNRGGVSPSTVSSTPPCTGRNSKEAWAEDVTPPTSAREDSNTWSEKPILKTARTSTFQLADVVRSQSGGAAPQAAFRKSQSTRFEEVKEPEKQKTVSARVKATGRLIAFSGRRKADRRPTERQVQLTSALKRELTSGSASLPSRTPSAWTNEGGAYEKGVALPKPLPYRGARGERIRRCTREDVWHVWDVFCLFDRSGTGEITRNGYISALADQPTVSKLRMLRKLDLENRFRRSARPLSKWDWMSLFWPGSSQEDLELMMRWAALRCAWRLMHSKTLGETEINRVYDLIDAESRGGDIPLGELVRAQILTQEDCAKIFRSNDLHLTINRETFRTVVAPHVKAKYDEEALKLKKAIA